MRSTARPAAGKCLAFLGGQAAVRNREAAPGSRTPRPSSLIASRTDRSYNRRADLGWRLCPRRRSAFGTNWNFYVGFALVIPFALGIYALQGRAGPFWLPTASLGCRSLARDLGLCPLRGAGLSACFILSDRGRISEPAPVGGPGATRLGCR